MMLAFYKRKPGSELQYYYIHDYQGSLFIPYTITAIWGKGSRKGRKEEYSFENRIEMDRKLREIVKRRIKEGYRLFYSYPMINTYNPLLQDIIGESAG